MRMISMKDQSPGLLLLAKKWGCMNGPMIMTYRKQADY